tara:strand:+ start:378 stop:800 length:423 start_codon:yes stop_codon:yes gene_type:complete
MIEDIKNKENVMILFLNTFYGWGLTPSEDEFEYYDAYGLSPKKVKSVIEMKFRDTHYSTMMLEKMKYDHLMSMDEETLKFYLVQDPTGIYIFWLQNIDKSLLKVNKILCPDTTFWGGKKIEKEVYLLPKEYASILILNTK